MTVPTTQKDTPPSRLGTAAAAAALTIALGVTVGVLVARPDAPAPNAADAPVAASTQAPTGSIDATEAQPPEPTNVSAIYVPERTDDDRGAERRHGRHEERDEEHEEDDDDD